MKSIVSIKKDLKNIRLDILDMAYTAKEGHVPSSLSVVEILYSIYSTIKKKDVFLLSKGHASAGFFAVLSHFGYISKNQLSSYCDYDSILGGHPHSRKIPVVVNSSGSLGHGLPMAVGYALSKKISKQKGMVYCLIGDGEANEGTVWESALYANNLKLDNLICIVDDNNSQIRSMPSGDIASKFSSFGWNSRIVDGHDVIRLFKVLQTNKVGRPLCIVAKTTKGKGIKTLEDNFLEWHHKSPTPEEFINFKKELS